MNYAQATHCGTLSRADVTARRASGQPVESISAEAGVSPATMWLALHDWGLTTPRGGDRRSPSWRARFGAQLGGAA